MKQCDCNILHVVVSRIQHLVNKNFFHLLFFHLGYYHLSSTIFSISLLKNMRLTTSQNALHFGMKCSKLCRLLGLCPRPRWGSLRPSPRPPSRQPSAIAASCLRRLHFPQISQDLSPPKLYTDFRLWPLGLLLP